MVVSLVLSFSHCGPVALDKDNLLCTIMFMKAFRRVRQSDSCETTAQYQRELEWGTLF